MKQLLKAALFGILLSNSAMAQQTDVKANTLSYDVPKLKKSIKIDADWDKARWKKVKPLTMDYTILAKPEFKPEVHAKMMYDDENLYVIFQVKDRSVRTVTTEINGPVWKDAAVEFFFAPDTLLPKSFFNLEVNSGGTPLLGYTGKKIALEDIQQIEIAHSLPKTVDPEIPGPITWVIEYRIPLAMIEKYSKVVHPAKGVTWRGNLYKIAEISSNPHYLSWSEIISPKPNFHMPQFFGYLNFQ
jgi:hypothetical protein